MHLSPFLAFSLSVDENCGLGILRRDIETPWEQRRLLRPDSILNFRRKELQESWMFLYWLC